MTLRVAVGPLMADVTTQRPGASPRRVAAGRVVGPLVLTPCGDV
jgi:hypothetical protein